MTRFLTCLMVVAGVAHAGQFSFDSRFTNAHLADLGEALADLLAFPNLTTAKPAGLHGFEAMGGVGGVRVSAREGWYRYALEQERWLGVLSASRVVVRKGLLAGVTLGAQYGRFAGEPFWGGEVRWSLYPGGTLLPAVALGAGYSWLANSLVDFGVGEVRLVLSKGFVLLTPYAGLGVRHQRLEAKFGEPVPRWHQTEGSRAVVTAGVVMYPLPLVRLVAEARKGFATTFAVAVGVAL